MRISPPTLLVVLVATQTAVAVFLYGLPGLGGAFRDAYGLSLTETGLILGAPAAGLTVALLGWGALGDRIGERRPLPAGMALAAVGCVVPPPPTPAARRRSGS
jgi:MFS family permease